MITAVAPHPKVSSNDPVVREIMLKHINLLEQFTAQVNADKGFVHNTELREKTASANRDFTAALAMYPDCAYIKTDHDAAKTRTFSQAGWERSRDETGRWITPWNPEHSKVSSFSVIRI